MNFFAGFFLAYIYLSISVFLQPESFFLFLPTRKCAQFSAEPISSTNDNDSFESRIDRKIDLSLMLHLFNGFMTRNFRLIYVFNTDRQPPSESVVILGSPLR